MIERIAAYFGFVRRALITEQLQFARSVGKRLDEHREVVEAMEADGFFEGKQWHVGHMAIQDDYLMRLYHMVYSAWPDDSVDNGRQATGEYVRARPAVLGPCTLPEFANFTR